MKNKILSGAMWLGISALILKIIGLIYKIPMSYILGDEGMGYFNSAYTVYTFFYIISSSGIPKAVSIICSKYDDEKAHAFFVIIYRTFIFIGLILSVILFMFSKGFSKLVATEKSALSIALISPSVFFVCASGVLRGYFNGKMKFAPIAVSELISGACKLILGVIFAYYGLCNAYSVPVIASMSILGITFGSLFGYIYLYVYYIKTGRNISKIAFPIKEALSCTLKIAIPITFASGLSSIVGILDLMLIMKGLNKSFYSETVSAIIYGNYTTLSLPMLSVVTTLINPISLAALPVLSKNYSEKRAEQSEKILKSTIFYSSYIYIPAFFVFLFFSFEVLSLIFETSSAILGYYFLSLLSPAVLFIGILTPINTAIESMGKVKITVTSLIVGSFVKMLLSVFLIKYTSLGALAAPIGTSVSYAVSLIISYLYLYIKYSLRVDIFRFLVPFCIAFIPAIVVMLIKNNKILFENCRLNSLSLLFIYGIMYIILLLLVFLVVKRSALCTKNTINDY